MLDHLNFRQQFAALLFIVLLAILAVFGIGEWSKQTLKNNVEILYQSGAKPIRALGEVASRLPRMRVAIDVMFLDEVGMAGDKSTLTRVQETRSEDMPAMRNSIEAAIKAQIDPERAAQITELQRAYLLMEQEALNPMLLALEQGRRDEAKAIYSGAYTKHYRTLRDHTNKALDFLVEDAAAVHTSAIEQYERSSSINMAVSVIAIVGALLLGVLIMLRLSRRVARLESELDDSASRLALNNRSSLEGSDEFARIGRSYNHLMQKLDHTVGNLQQFTVKVKQTVDSIEHIATGINQSSLAQTDAAQSTAASVEQVAVSVQVVAENSRHAAQQSEAVQQKATQSTQSLQSMQSQFTTMSETLDHASQITGQLAERSQSISSIVSVIRDIAEQTNLLALNAAIEAARAGELGRGFAVVADEVRKLAERTSSATREIGQLLSGIQGEINQVVVAMDQGQTQMQAGQTLVISARQLVVEISNDANSASDNVRSIADSTREQGQAANTIAQRIEQIVIMADHNHGAITQAQTSIGQLAAMAEELRHELASFKTSAS